MQNYAVLVKPGSKKGPLVERTGEKALTVYIRERAVEGKANEAVVALLAKHFGTSKSQIQIVRGHTSRAKIVSVSSKS